MQQSLLAKSRGEGPFRELPHCHSGPIAEGNLHGPSFPAGRRLSYVENIRNNCNRIGLPMDSFHDCIFLQSGYEADKLNSATARKAL